MGCLRPRRQDGRQALGKVITQPKAAEWKSEDGLYETVEGQVKKSDGYQRTAGQCSTHDGSHYCCWCGITDERTWLEESDTGEHKHQPLVGCFLLACFSGRGPHGVPLMACLPWLASHGVPLTAYLSWVCISWGESHRRASHGVPLRRQDISDFLTRSIEGQNEECQLTCSCLALCRVLHTCQLFSTLLRLSKLVPLTMSSITFPLSILFAQRKLVKEGVVRIGPLQHREIED